MNDLQWRRHGHDHGDALAEELGWTVLSLLALHMRQAVGQNPDPQR
jgi:hypothetical protein